MPVTKRRCRLRAARSRRPRGRARSGSRFVSLGPGLRVAEAGLEAHAVRPSPRPTVIRGITPVVPERELRLGEAPVDARGELGGDSATRPATSARSERNSLTDWSRQSATTSSSSVLRMTETRPSREKMSAMCAGKPRSSPSTASSSSPISARAGGSSPVAAQPRERCAERRRGDHRVARHIPEPDDQLHLGAGRTRSRAGSCAPSRRRSHPVADLDRQNDSVLIAAEASTACHISSGGDVRDEYARSKSGSATRLFGAGADVGDDHDELPLGRGQALSEIVEAADQYSAGRSRACRAAAAARACAPGTPPRAGARAGKRSSPSSRSTAAMNQPTCGKLLPRNPPTRSHSPPRAQALEKAQLHHRCVDAPA